MLATTSCRTSLFGRDSKTSVRFAEFCVSFRTHICSSDNFRERGPEREFGWCQRIRLRNLDVQLRDIGRQSFQKLPTAYSSRAKKKKLRRLSRTQVVSRREHMPSVTASSQWTDDKTTSSRRCHNRPERRASSSATTIVSTALRFLASKPKRKSDQKINFNREKAAIGPPPQKLHQEISYRTCFSIASTLCTILRINGSISLYCFFFSSLWPCVYLMFGLNYFI